MHYDNDLLDLRSLISFAEATWLPVKATFSVGGSPITFSIQQDAVLEVKKLNSVAAAGEKILAKYRYNTWCTLYVHCTKWRQFNCDFCYTIFTNAEHM